MAKLLARCARSWHALRVSRERLPPYATSGALAVLASCAVEIAVVPGARPGSLALALLGLAPLLGAIPGLLLSIVLVLVAHGCGQRGRVSSTFWFATGLVSGLALAAALHAFERLGSEHDGLAKLTVLGSVLAGVTASIVLVLLTPTAQAPAGPWAAREANARRVIGVTLATVSLGAATADRELYVGLYPLAHDVVRLASMGGLTIALALNADAMRIPRGSRWRAALALALAAGTIAVTPSERAVHAMVQRPLSRTVLRAARGVLDLDRDGFSALLRGGDCDDLNPHVHPEAREIAGNGVDDNCLLGDRAPRAEPTPGTATAEGTSPTSVVLVTIDTLRWDRFGPNDGAYDATGRATMPELERWAARGVVYRRAYSPGAWTSIALGSMMRGIYPRRLAWTAYYETNHFRLLRPPLRSQLAGGERTTKMFPVAWNDPHAPLAELLRRRGMSTAAIVDDGYSQMLSSSVGVARGFDVFREVSPDVAGDSALVEQATDADTCAMALAELQRLAADDAPFFLWVHFFGPHSPSSKHDEMPSQGNTPEELYDNEVRFADRQLGILRGSIDAMGRPVAVFVTADHGEMFAGGLRGHGMDLSDQLVRVPLVAIVPGWAPGVLEEPVSTLDLVPTILELTRTPSPHALDGISLDPRARSLRAAEGLSFTETWRYDAHGRVSSALVGAISGRRKVVLDRVDRVLAAYPIDTLDAPSEPVEPGSEDARIAQQLLRYMESTGGQIALALDR